MNERVKALIRSENIAELPTTWKDRTTGEGGIGGGNQNSFLTIAYDNGLFS